MRTRHVRVERIAWRPMRAHQAHADDVLDAAASNRLRRSADASDDDAWQRGSEFDACGGRDARSTAIAAFSTKHVRELGKWLRCAVTSAGVLSVGVAAGVESASTNPSTTRLRLRAPLAQPQGPRSRTPPVGAATLERAHPRSVGARMRVAPPSMASRSDLRTTAASPRWRLGRPRPSPRRTSDDSRGLPSAPATDPGPDWRLPSKTLKTEGRGRLRASVPKETTATQSPKIVAFHYEAKKKSRSSSGLSNDVDCHRAEADADQGARHRDRAPCAGFLPTCS